MMRSLSMSVAALVVFSYALPAMSQSVAQVSPTDFIKKIADDVLNDIKSDISYESDSTKLQTMVNTRIAPYFDFARLTQLAVARHWRTANHEQQTQLTEQFSRLLVRTYSNALLSYRHQNIDYLPQRSVQAGQDVLVRTRVHGGGKSSITVDFTLYPVKNSWKAYDVTVAGVSLVTNYRDEFNATIREKGVDGLIELLKEKNTKPLAPKAQ